MKTLSKLSIPVCMILISITSAAQPSEEHVEVKAVSEYTLLLRYPDVAYTPEQNQKLKEQWQKVISSWKSRGIFLSNQIFEPRGILISGTDGKVHENTFAEGDSFLGATITLFAKNKQQAIAFAKETPVLDIGGSIEIREPRYANNDERVTLIDIFTIPVDAKKAFMERMDINRNLLFTLSGFIEDSVYEKLVGETKYNYITVATWKNTEAIEMAKKAIANLYLAQHFNMNDFLTKNNIRLERAIFKKIK